MRILTNTNKDALITGLFSLSLSSTSGRNAAKLTPIDVLGGGLSTSRAEISLNDVDGFPPLSGRYDTENSANCFRKSKEGFATWIADAIDCCKLCWYNS